MKESRRNGQQSRLLPATAFATGLVGFPPGSLESRAAARALVLARERSENNEGSRSLGLAERLDMARRRAKEARERGEPKASWGPLPENPKPGSLAARMVAARARVARFAQDQERRQGNR